MDTTDTDLAPVRRRHWWIWLGVFALLVVAVWFVAGRKESPQAALEPEIEEIFTVVRKQDRMGFQVRSLGEKMQDWPPPLPAVGRLFFGARDSYDYYYDASERLASLGWPAVPTLTNALVRHRSPTVRETVAEALGEMGDPRLVPPLLAAFPLEKEDRVKTSILDALGELRDHAAEPLLIATLQSTNTRALRESAAGALARFDSLTAITALTNAFAAEADASVRQSLLPYGNDAAAISLMRYALAQDTDANVRHRAAQGLAYSDDEGIKPALLTAAREDSDARVRAGAIDALRGRATADLRDFLIDALLDLSQEVRAAAAKALGSFRNDDPVEALLLERLATDSAADVRSAAATALGDLVGSPPKAAVADALVATLQNDADAEVRAAAAASLSRIGNEPAIAALTAALGTERQGRVQSQAIGGLYRLPSPELTTFLLKLLDSPNLADEGRIKAIRGLGETQSAGAMLKLIALLTADPDDQARSTAAAALGRFDDAKAAEALRTALQKDPKEPVREAAATALGEMASAHVVAGEALAVALRQDANVDVRAAAAVALGRLRDTNALPALLLALQKDPNRDVRRNAVRALGRLSRPEAAPRLQNALLKDRDREVRALAAQSLAALSATNHAKFLLSVFEKDLTVRAEVAGVLGQLASPEAREALLQAMNRGGRNERVSVLQSLGDAGEARALAPLMVLLKEDPNSNVRAAAATALGRLVNAEAVPALEAALTDRAASVRSEAAWALGHIGDARAGPTLTAVLNEGDSKTLFATVYALAEIGDASTIPAIAALLPRADEQTRLAAASALAFLGNAQGVDILSRHLRASSTWTRFTALISLLRLDTPEARRLLENCRDSDPTLAGAIEAGLRQGAAQSAANMLNHGPDEDDMTSDYRHFGARALVFFRDPATLPALRANANDPREDVRSAVRIAIRRIEQREQP